MRRQNKRKSALNVRSLGFFSCINVILWLEENRGNASMDGRLDRARRCTAAIAAPAHASTPPGARLCAAGTRVGPRRARPTTATALAKKSATSAVSSRILKLRQLSSPTNSISSTGCTGYISYADFAAIMR